MHKYVSPGRLRQLSFLIPNTLLHSFDHRPSIIGEFLIVGGSVNRSAFAKDLELISSRTLNLAMTTTAATAPNADVVWANNPSHSFANAASVKSPVAIGSVSDGFESHGSIGLFDAEALSIRCHKCHYFLIECQCVESHPVGPAYCPNPNNTDVPREYETHVQIFVRVPEMVPVDKTFYKKEVVYEERTILVPKSRIVYDEVEHCDLVPVVKMVPKTRTEICYIVTDETIEVTEIVLEVEFEDVCRIDPRPRVITEDCEETIMVPVVKEVPVVRLVEEWTGRYCESEVEKFCSSGNFNLICEDSCHQHGSGHIHYKPSKSSASSMCGDQSPPHGRGSGRIRNGVSLSEKDFASAAAAKGLGILIPK